MRKPSGRSKDCNLVGRWQDALDDREIGEKTGSLDGGAWAEYSRSFALYKLGYLQEARDSAAAGLELAENIGDGRLVIWLARSVSSKQIWVGTRLPGAMPNGRDPRRRVRAGDAEASQEIAAHLSLARESGAPHYVAVGLRMQGRILTAQERWDEAARAFDTAIAKLDELGSRLELGRAMY